MPENGTFAFSTNVDAAAGFGRQALMDIFVRMD
jgi:hypothetical protein